MVARWQKSHNSTRKNVLLKVAVNMCAMHRSIAWSPAFTVPTQVVPAHCSKGTDTYRMGVG